MGPRWSISFLFLINGFILANWVTRIPDVSQALALSSGQLGVALLGMGAGALTAFPLTGSLIAKVGSATATTGFAIVYAMALPILVATSNVWTLFLGLALFGFANGGMDVSMNAQGVEVELELKRNIISSLHGFFSLGGLAGAGSGALFSTLGVGAGLHFLLVGTIALSTSILASRHLVRSNQKSRERQEEKAPLLSLPPRAVWGLGIMGMCAAIGEGATADWSALYLRESLGASPGIASLGYAGFSVTMLIGRFSGDKVVSRVGAKKVIRGGAAVSVIGLGLSLLTPFASANIVGFSCVGLGLSVTVPLIFAAAASHPTISSGVGVAGVATFVYGAFLLGPPTLGWIAEWSSLRAALALVVISSGAIIVLPFQNTQGVARKSDFGDGT